jgi:hypothetical protein
VSCKKQELLSLHEHLRSSPVVFFLFFVFLFFVYYGHNNTNPSHLAVALTFYSDSKYQHEFSGFPPSYMIGDNVYVKVQTHINDDDVKMRLLVYGV